VVIKKWNDDSRLNILTSPYGSLNCVSGCLKIILSYKQSQTQENNYLIFSIEINIILLYTYIKFSDITYYKKNNKNNLLY
ncbi:MAG: hypothetical protein IJM09_05880, partial [Neisseriaceae bacterium]|nr:hypothetical protein [Neisseriaceae bacterium]